ncbi:MAG: hypothetical protein HRU13_11655 [Phycisphaerales bacterium]|nr:hypothetical protein [Phycisphaerales bacterium]
MTRPDTPAPDGGSRPVPGDAAEPIIAATLTERLRCAACSYDLRGLSVLDRCPECGLRIATSILAIVDPRAQEFEPIRRPRAVAIGLLAWALGALLAALCAWLQRAAELPALNNAPYLIGDDGEYALAVIGSLGVVVSGVGAFALVRPAQHMSARGTRMAFAGVLLYVPLTVAYFILHGTVDVGLASVYFGRYPDAERVLVRAIELSLVTGIVLLLRSNARELAARSAILRTGRADRQTMYAVAGCAILGILGDIARLAAVEMDGALGQLLGIAGVTIVALFSALLTMGMIGVMIDCTRIARALLRSGTKLTSLVSMVDVARQDRPAEAAS